MSRVSTIRHRIDHRDVLDAVSESHDGQRNGWHGASLADTPRTVDRPRSAQPFEGAAEPHPNGTTATPTAASASTRRRQRGGLSGAAAGDCHHRKPVN
jgi:hypothetical protein